MKLQSIVLGAALLSAITPAGAEPRRSHDWQWDIDGDSYYYAATATPSGHAFGQYCYFDSGSCYYLIGVKTTCDIGDEYPALLNSDAGSAHVTLICSHKFDDYNVFFITPFDDIDRIAKSASRVGFAVPLQNDLFKVVRFSLEGSTYAIESMRRAAEQRIRNQPSRGKRPSEELL